MTTKPRQKTCDVAMPFDLPVVDYTRVLTLSMIKTPLGQMLAIADDEALYALEFIERIALQQTLSALSHSARAMIKPGTTKIIGQIESELAAYFDGTLKIFKTPLATTGTDFQKTVWEALRAIPYGETCSYAQLASIIGHPNAFRAVARANATNKLAVIIPCHRVINKNGGLGGYAGGVARKEALIALEKIA